MPVCGWVEKSLLPAREETRRRDARKRQAADDGGGLGHRLFNRRAARTDDFFGRKRGDQFVAIPHLQFAAPMGIDVRINAAEDVVPTVGDPTVNEGAGWSDFLALAVRGIEVTITVVAGGAKDGQDVEICHRFALAGVGVESEAEGVSTRVERPTVRAQGVDVDEPVRLRMRTRANQAGQKRAINIVDMRRGGREAIASQHPQEEIAVLGGHRRVGEVNISRSENCGLGLVVFFVVFSGFDRSRSERSCGQSHSQ